MKNLVLGAVLAVISVPAFATKARLLALGETEDVSGSQYISDNRNIFLNSAYVNDYKDQMFLEWGANGATAGAVKEDTDTAPQAEGGFLKSHGDMVYGLYLGAESYITHEVRKYTRFNEAKFHQDNQIDVFVGGGSNVKWGANLTYSGTKDSATHSRQSSASVRLGAITEKLEGFANIALLNQARTQSVAAGTGNPNGGRDQFKGRLGYEVGATYNLEFAKVFAYWRHAGWNHDGQSDLMQNATTPLTAYKGKFEGESNKYRVGLGREHSLTEKTRLFSKIAYIKVERHLDVKSGGANGKTIKLDDWSVPLTLGLEHDAASWLTVRGSVSQNLMSQENNNYAGQDALVAAAISNNAQGSRKPGKRTFNNSTNVNAGATLKFGDLSFDGMIGTGNDGAGNIANSNTSTANNEKGILSLDNLMTRVAMTYKF